MIGLVTNKLQSSRLSDSLTELSFLSKLKLKLKFEGTQDLIKSTFINNLKIIDLVLANTTFCNQTIPKHHNSKQNRKVVHVSPEIGEAKIKNLADVCQRSEKDVFLQLPHASELPQINQAIAWNVKRAIDWLAALIILLVLSPVMLGLAATIASTSNGPIFFYQWRVGENGKLFRIIKFRTMITDADKLHHLVMTGQTGLHKCEDDPRITPVGRWMRKYSLDELPQLFNVLLGEMSLVGPRPWALYDALRINGNGKRRLNSLPGVTGAWQVSARSTMLDLDAVTECDLSYLRNWNLWADLKILLMTIPKVLSGFGAF